MLSLLTRLFGGRVLLVEAMSLPTRLFGALPIRLFGGRVLLVEAMSLPTRLFGGGVLSVEAMDVVAY